MTDLVKPLKHYFYHHCAIPHALSFRHRIFTCEVCGVTWTQERQGTWHTNHSTEVEVVEVTIRWADGSLHSFSETESVIYEGGK